LNEHRGHGPVHRAMRSPAHGAFFGRHVAGRHAAGHDRLPRDDYVYFIVNMCRLIMNGDPMSARYLTPTLTDKYDAPADSSCPSTEISITATGHATRPCSHSIAASRRQLGAVLAPSGQQTYAEVAVSGDARNHRAAGTKEHNEAEIAARWMSVHGSHPGTSVAQKEAARPASSWGALAQGARTANPQQPLDPSMVLRSGPTAPCYRAEHEHGCLHAVSSSRGTIEPVHRSTEGQ